MIYIVYCINFICFLDGPFRNSDEDELDFRFVRWLTIEKVITMTITITV